MFRGISCHGIKVLMDDISQDKEDSEMMVTFLPTIAFVTEASIRNGSANEEFIESGKFIES